MVRVCVRACDKEKMQANSQRERERRTGQEGINHEVSNFSGREREVGRKDSETPKRSPKGGSQVCCCQATALRPTTVRRGWRESRSGERILKEEREALLCHCACVTQSRDAPRRYRCISSSRSTRKQQNTTRRLQRLLLQPASCQPPRARTAANAADVNKGEGERRRLSLTRAQRSYTLRVLGAAFRRLRRLSLQRKREKIVPRFNRVLYLTFAALLCLFSCISFCFAHHRAGSAKHLRTAAPGVPSRRHIDRLARRTRMYTQTNVMTVHAIELAILTGQCLPQLSPSAPQWRDEMQHLQALSLYLSLSLTHTHTYAHR